jgi:hypothetical protein
MKLKPRAAVHRRKQLLVLRLAFDLDPGTQQVARTVDPFGGRADATVDAFAEGHRGSESPVQELGDPLQARNPFFAQIATALFDQRMVGT